ncbi:MAG: T9SS type A sorting domain-containing protein, partial [Bacteroidia bacterium]|nr:T9SS type A sorting domain-containing protein [Bacteroidia bacterium]
VILNDTFMIDAGNAGKDYFSSSSYMHIFDAVNGTLLQTVGFHTSCSVPITIGDAYGAATLIGLEDKYGVTCGEMPHAALVLPEDITERAIIPTLTDQFIEVKAYPNPFVLELTIDLYSEGDIGDVRIELINDLGELVEYKELRNVGRYEEVRFRGDNIIGGMYYVRTISSSGEARLKVIKLGN